MGIELITIKESANILRVSERTVRRMIHDNHTLDLQGKKGRSFLVDKSIVLKIAENQNKPRAQWKHPGY